MKRLERRASFGGWQEVWEHDATTVSCPMRFGIYLPPQAADGPCPVLYFLSGLTCTEQNFITKAGAQQYAAEHGVIIVAPDTSPRGESVADADTYDLGQGAGFYLNATREPWAAHYQMYDYIVEELPALVDAHFPTNGKRSISGHSMGGHGALVIALKNPGMFASVSAFSPIVSPSTVPWGEQAFTSYLGEDRDTWAEWDACALVRSGASAESPRELLVDQGAADDFLDGQLKSHLLAEACETMGYPLRLRMHEGYDHSYYFIATLIGEHIAYHADALHA